jgi:hypothetical protein
MASTGHLNWQVSLTIWWEPGRPDVINVCSGDRRLVSDHGGRPGLWIKVRRSSQNRSAWNRLAQALAEAGQSAPPLVP